MDLNLFTLSRVRRASATNHVWAYWRLCASVTWPIICGLLASNIQKSQGSRQFGVVILVDVVAVESRIVLVVKVVDSRAHTVATVVSPVFMSACGFVTPRSVVFIGEIVGVWISRPAEPTKEVPPSDKAGSNS